MLQPLQEMYADPSAQQNNTTSSSKQEQGEKHRGNSVKLKF